MIIDISLLQKHAFTAAQAHFVFNCTLKKPKLRHSRSFTYAVHHNKFFFFAFFLSTAFSVKDGTSGTSRK